MAAPPHTYTFSQFHQHTGGDPAAYNKYLRYVANFRANKLAHMGENPLNGDALQPLAPAVQVPRLHQMAASEINPLLGQENAGYRHDVTAATNSLAGYSKSLASFYQPQSQQMENNLHDATSSMAGTNAALGSTLTAGPAGMGDLSKYLGMAGGPQGAATANLGTTGANLLAARGAAAIGGAIGGGTAAANSAAFLPTFAAQTGRETLGNTLDAYGAAHTKNRAALLAQEPGIFNRLYQTYMNEEIQKAVARNSGLVSQANATSTATRTSAYAAAQGAKTYQAVNPVTGKKQTIPAGYVIDKQGRVVKGPSGTKPAPISGPGSKRYQSYTKARNSATGTAKQIVLGATKPIATTKQLPNPLGPDLPPVTQTVKARVPNYWGTIRKIVSTVTPYLSPYMGPRDITRFVQGIVNGYYEPGQYGRPGSGKTSTPPSKHPVP